MKEEDEQEKAKDILKMLQPYISRLCAAIFMANGFRKEIDSRNAAHPSG